ncbi:uncharacterized protein LAESUDRAFT_714143 [Laetiporus sulphureus 93-53]|uniref:Uncharacterized protein n=1 Tax=Laetiporus sulphureus 93-53 TaxID=1314785 RepID=A0A165EC09_9APHY|nr:uncharacterized protein LAESUDRAFT_714143 [Laetiporus sulphureus 93-53]KZT06698.1 hypothetical protein LAESUDRAFT_714143 [Laetiporus sulphureus 93-53]
MSHISKVDSDEDEHKPHTKHVNDIVRKLTANFPAISQAREEANRTFHRAEQVAKSPEKKNICIGPLKGVGKANLASGSKATIARVVSGSARVVSISVFPVRLKNVYQQQLQNLGLGILNVQNEFLFWKSWTPAQMHAFLCNHLPMFFCYLAMKDPWVLTIGAHDDEELALLELLYVLLSKEDWSMNVVNISHPDESNYFTYKSRSSMTWQDSHVWIGLREIIDLDDFKEWAEQQKVDSAQVGREDGKSASIASEGSDLKGKAKVPANPQSNTTTMVAKHPFLLFLEDDTDDEIIERGLHSPSPTDSAHLKRIKRSKILSEVDVAVGGSSSMASGSLTDAASIAAASDAEESTPAAKGGRIDIDLSNVPDSKDEQPTTPIAQPHGGPVQGDDLKWQWVESVGMRKRTQRDGKHITGGSTHGAGLRWVRLPWRYSSWCWSIMRKDDGWRDERHRSLEYIGNVGHEASLWNPHDAKDGKTP